MDWQKKDIWYKDGEYFRVEIVHWSRPELKSYSSYYPEKHCWNTYLYIYPKHPWFSRLDRNAQSWEQDVPVEWHGEATYFRAHTKENGDISSFQIGDDYAHYMDDRFENYSTLAEAWEVEVSAANIYEAAQRASKGEPND